MILNDLTIQQSTDEEANENMFKEAIKQLGRRYFVSNHAYCRQQNYLCYHVFMRDMEYKAFKAELLRQNMHLKYFPVPDDRESCDPLPEDKLVEIVDQAKRIKWQCNLPTANINPYSMSLDAYSQYLEKLEAKHAINKAMRKDNTKRKEKGKNDDSQPSQKHKKNSKNLEGKKGKSNHKEACKHCNKWHPVPNDKCWSFSKNADNRPKKKPFSKIE